MNKFDVFVFVFLVFLVISKTGIGFWKSKEVAFSESLAEEVEQNSTSFVGSEQKDFDPPERMPQALSVYPQKESNELNKRELLGANYYQAKKSEEELMRDFNRHLSKLQKFCESSEYQTKELKKILLDFIAFLKNEKQDPYMLDLAKLKFNDVLSSIEDHNGQPVTDLDDFTLSYRRLYNSSEDLKIEGDEEDYSSWARIIYKAIQCAS